MRKWDEREVEATRLRREPRGPSLQKLFVTTAFVLLRLLQKAFPLLLVLDHSVPYALG